jgi:hypothetical protein
MTSTADTMLAQYVLNVTAAIRDGKLHVRPEDVEVMAELMSAPRGIMGNLDVAKLSGKAKSFARTAGMALRYFNSEANGTSQETVVPIAADLQVRLFRLYANLFTALTGTGVVSVADLDELQQRMIARGRDNRVGFASQVNAAAEEMQAYYKENAQLLFKTAKTFGGVKLVSGGQRSFGPSALNAVRITGLYADTQLIPDPVFPYFSGDLNLNAQLLQLARGLYHILQLRPLIDAQLPTPPVFVFPSFEIEFESRDAVTMQGISDLAYRLLAPVCEGTFSSLEELNEYARRHQTKFVDAVMAERLFVPPGSSPSETMSGDEAVKRYLAELEGVRSSDMLAEMRKAPPAALIMNGILERLAPQYHLYENSTELDAQPLLSQEAHWHYYEKCAQATAGALVRKNILSEQSFQTIRALQDDSLGWLANIPIDGLVELTRNQEHRVLRKELKEYTSQLVAAGPAELNQVVREVNHALADLVQRQQKALRDIEDKYAPKKWGTYVGGVLTVGAAATAIWYPALAPSLGLAAPAIALGAGAVGTAVGYGKEKVGETVEKQRANKTMLGMLACARPK